MATLKIKISSFHVQFLPCSILVLWSSLILNISVKLNIHVVAAIIVDCCSLIFYSKPSKQGSKYNQSTDKSSIQHSSLPKTLRTILKQLIV